jgi:hypothetical protein
MTIPNPLVRLRPFEGLCLTAEDLATEQTYHRQNLARQTLFVSGHGVVQGLTVELELKRKKYTATVKSGFGITENGQGVHLADDAKIPMPVPKTDGEYILWLYHVESLDESENRPVFDTQDTVSARVIEGCAPRMHPANEVHENAVALTRIKVRLGRMVKVQLPVPRAGRQSRAAESYLKPRVVNFIRLSKKVQDNLFRTSTVQEISFQALGFYSSLVSAEFLLIEEGTSDRVLYQVAGSLIQYAHAFFNSLPSTTDRIAKYTEFIRRVNAEVPSAEQADETWLKWFLQFERILGPLERISEELDSTVEASR